MKWIANLIRDYFGFSATELRGFWLLSFLAIILLVVNAIFKPLIIRLNQSQIYATDSYQIDSLVAILEQLDTPPSETIKSNSVVLAYELFDPNTASAALLSKNGLPSWLAERIIKYREKGGKFLIKDDLLKIYGFPTDLHTTLLPYIQLPAERKNIPVSKVTYKKPKAVYGRPDRQQPNENLKFNINTVDSVALQQLPGIGKVLSSRIVRFRDKLGGFYNQDQLSEIYHMPPEVAQTLRANTYIKSDFTVNKININEDDVSTLASHPYISFSLAKAIIKHRENYGKYERLEDCREVYLMKEATFQKIAPYLSL